MNPPESAQSIQKKVVISACFGTFLEWYDFLTFASLAIYFSVLFFPADDPVAALLASLGSFGVGMIVRPLGAALFGSLGDRHGRRTIFLATIVLMGVSTVCVGLLPTYDQVGLLAPALLLLLRMLQGLSVGGEVGGAAVYLTEHAPEGKRGLYTSVLQLMGPLGMMASTLQIVVLQHFLSDADFKSWGWRIPFILSVLLLGVSVYIRLSMNESPAFAKMKAEGKTSKAPLSESFGQWKNLKIVILALVGLTAGQAVVWYAGQFYALFFLTQALKVDGATANIMVAISLVIGTPFFVIFGTLSDKIGRKPIIMLGCLLAVLTYFPVFTALTKAANPDLAAAQLANKVVVTADPAECSFQFNPTGTVKFTSSCDVAKQALASASVSYDNAVGASGAPATITVGSTVINSYSAKGVSKEEAKALSDEFKKSLGEALKAANYPAKADMAKFDKVMVAAILTYLVILVTMVYGPIAAMLVEMFPTRIRYTSMSLPYHIGNGWFGGLLPTTAFAIVAQTGNMYNGLWYPIIIAGMTFVIGVLFVKETKDVDIYAND